MSDLNISNDQRKKHRPYYNSQLFVSLKLHICCELVLGSFLIRFLFVISSLDGQILQLVCAYSKFFIFLRIVEGSSSQFNP